MKRSAPPSDDDRSTYLPRGIDEGTALSISELTMRIKGLVEGSLPRVWVEGEISDLSRPSSGHLYLTLKDDRSQIRAVVWRTVASRLPFKIADGLSVVCCGGIEVYPPRGTYQLVIQQLQPKGIGALELAFRQLHAKLSAEGLFDPARKKALPKFPRRIAFVTSPSGAALHDFLEAARKNWPAFELLVIPVRVQGEGAAQEIAEGIRAAQKILPELDVLIVGRGGGSMEDLWCFNDERVVRALAACRIPTVSAVGHEIDVTLSDLAADARALTPTQAAHLILPDKNAIGQSLLATQANLKQLMLNRIRHLMERVHSLGQRHVIRQPQAMIAQRRQTLDEWDLRGRSAVWNQLNKARQSLQELARASHALSPLQVLARGYSLTCDAQSGRLIHAAEDVRVGQNITSTLDQLRITSQISAIERLDPKHHVDAESSSSSGGSGGSI